MRHKTFEVMEQLISAVTILKSKSKIAIFCPDQNRNRYLC